MSDLNVPNKVKPGYAVIVDKNGVGARVIECYMVCEASRGSEVRPIEGRLRGTVFIGALIDKVKAGELVVAQWAPYPAKRDDNMPHVIGALAYPGPNESYTEFDGVNYHVVHGRKYLEAAQAEAANPEPVTLNLSKKGS